MRFALPLAVLIALLALFAVGLQRDPRRLPSPLIGKRAPAFDLPTIALPGPPGAVPPPARMTQADLRGAPVLVNFFASWCAGCQDEHPFLMELARSGEVRLVGIDYKDAESDLRRWLGRHGDPYAVVLSDLSGNTGIDWGVYGVPETFVLDAQGRIVFKQIGPLTPEAWQRIRPLLQGSAS